MLFKLSREINIVETKHVQRGTIVIKRVRYFRAIAWL